MGTKINSGHGLYDPRFERDSCGVGFVCHIKGQKSNDIVLKGLEVLKRLAHRGATGADPLTGDGAGILIQMPHSFFKKVSKKAGIKLPDQGDYGAGLVFLPQDKKQRDTCKKIFDEAAKESGQSVLGWRAVPVDSKKIGVTAQSAEPVIEQVFIRKAAGITDLLTFERKLYIIRKTVERRVKEEVPLAERFFYITNLSARTFSYKGLLMPGQVSEYFLDLADKDIHSSIALVHSRYSTNTFPTWDLAQPFRFIAHNGEINTLRGNVNWMRAKEKLLASELFGDDIEKIKPIINDKGSDSAILDNVFELLTLSGRSLAHAMLMLIPAAWEKDPLIPEGLKDFYKYNECLMEPWDGPAAVAFTDGTRIGAVLDRNGLRPARYLITKDDMVVVASEVGVLDIDPSHILRSGRLEPGKIFFINTEAGKVIEDEEMKSILSKTRPYSEWVRENILELDHVPSVTMPPKTVPELHEQQKAFGYTREDIRTIIKPMVETAQEPVGAMGNDTPHAVLSKKPQLLYSYFKQLFAQVTNPPIDPIREELVMSLASFMGPRKNLLSETPGHCHKLLVKYPILTNDELEKIRAIKMIGFRSRTISILFDAKDESNFSFSLDRICKESEEAIKNGDTFIILSDRGVTKDLAAIPALIALGAVHQHLVKKSLRSSVGLVLETAEPREVHHFAVLLGFGAGFINPYLAYETINNMVETGQVSIDKEKAAANYIKAVNKGVQKVLSKMGISTIRSYRGAQIFEALGLAEEVIKRCFTGTVSRIGGADFAALIKERLMLHRQGFSETSAALSLSSGGLYQWKKDGEFHMWNPESIAALQDAVRNNDERRFREFTSLINEQSNNPTTLRGLLSLKKIGSLPLDQVESVENIMKRFATGAMSFGSISRGAHESIAIALNRIGGRSNTGEGGEDPARFAPMPNGDLKRSAIKQVASGRFGVTTNYLTNADEIQIKIAQGAKPGEGGQLPGHKVSAIIARTRYTTQGVTLISPPPHHDIYSIEDLAQLIFDLKNVNPRARISVKLVSEIGVGTVAAGVAKGHADMILISGGDGGTGASPISSIRHAGLPWELGLAESHQTLVLNDLRSRVRLQTDGQLRTGKDVAVAAMLGAEEFGFATSMLVSLGCVMLRHCNLNNCSVGVATQDELLERRFTGKPEHIVNFFRFLANDLREIMAGLGIKRVDDLIGRTDLLEMNSGILPWKSKGVDLSKMLYRPEVSDRSKLYCTQKQDHNIQNVMDRVLIEKAKSALAEKKAVVIELPISNTDRTTGAMLSGEICKVYGEEGLTPDTVRCKFKGVAGQSFGAFLMKGVTLELEGMANDYVGKGISGGTIIVHPSKKALFKAEDNIIIGNTAFYGAISGEAYIRGMAGERFCIRNSGLYGVVEGVGDHGCEYMTGGRVVILGKTGKNFAAGMSGGIAYVYCKDDTFIKKCNKDMIDLDPLAEDDIKLVKALLRNHIKHTGSTLAKGMLENFDAERVRFVKVIASEYKELIETGRVKEKAGVLEEYLDG